MQFGHSVRMHEHMCSFGYIFIKILDIKDLVFNMAFEHNKIYLSVASERRYIVLNVSNFKSKTKTQIKLAEYGISGSSQ